MYICTIALYPNGYVYTYINYICLYDPLVSGTALLIWTPSHQKGVTRVTLGPPTGKPLNSLGNWYSNFWVTNIASEHGD